MTAEVEELTIVESDTEALADDAQAVITDQNPPQQNKDHALAMISGEPVFEMPEDLFIPPEALLVFLDAFEGPLDLLLYLIKRQNLDILDIPIAEITRQYVAYIDLMQELRLELAAEYLVMAAMLAEIKSRLLLPRSQEEGSEDEDDPRTELIRRLQLYEQFKNAAEDLDSLPRYERDVFNTVAQAPDLKQERPLPDVDLRELLFAFKAVLDRTEKNASHQISRESLSVRERMTNVLERLKSDNFVTFTSLFTFEEGRMGVVVTFIAILELLKQSMVEIVQSEAFSPIHLKVCHG